VAGQERVRWLEGRLIELETGRHPERPLRDEYDPVIHDAEEREQAKELPNAVWTVAQLQETFDEWVIACWQNRPHEGLSHTWGEVRDLSPNEMYAICVGSSPSPTCCGSRRCGQASAQQLALEYALRHHGLLGQQGRQNTHTVMR
jgi:hypothetical protein